MGTLEFAHEWREAGRCGLAAAGPGEHGAASMTG